MVRQRLDYDTKLRLAKGFKVLLVVGLLAIIALLFNRFSGGHNILGAVTTPDGGEVRVVLDTKVHPKAITYKLHVFGRRADGIWFAVHSWIPESPPFRVARLKLASPEPVVVIYVDGSLFGAVNYKTMSYSGIAVDEPAAIMSVTDPLRLYRERNIPSYARLESIQPLKMQAFPRGWSPGERFPDPPKGQTIPFEL